MTFGTQGRVGRATGCGLLLDVNNVFVSARIMRHHGIRAISGGFGYAPPTAATICRSPPIGSTRNSPPSGKRAAIFKARSSHSLLGEDKVAKKRKWQTTIGSRVRVARPLRTLVPREYYSERDSTTARFFRPKNEKTKNV
jgi:hypothetical protein